MLSAFWRIFIGQFSTHRLQFRHLFAKRSAEPAPAGKRIFFILCVMSELNFIPALYAAAKVAIARPPIRKRRREDEKAVEGVGFRAVWCPYDMPLLWHKVRHLKHLIQVSLSMVLFLKSMQPEGHFCAHKPQATQMSVFMYILL